MNRDQFFAEACRRVMAGTEPDFIAAVGSAPDFDLYDVRDLLEQIPDPWKGRPSVMRSLEATLKAFCRRFCRDVTRNRYYEVRAL